MRGLGEGWVMWAGSERAGGGLGDVGGEWEGWGRPG